MKRAILVKSCQFYRDRQAACRQTWLGSLSAADINIVIVEAGHDEEGILGSTICLTGDDSHYSLTTKLREALRMNLARGEYFEQLFICDDDTFVHPQRWLAHEPDGELECRMFRPTAIEDIKRVKGRPWLHGGSGFWMSRRLCQWYVDEVIEINGCDDVCAARVARDHGVETSDRPDLYGDDKYGEPSGFVSADNNLITCHSVEPAGMLALYEATNGLN